jgi:hypothetical protein
MKLLVLSCLLLLGSCATRVYHSPAMEYKVTASYDPVEKSIHRDYNYSDGILVYKQMINTKQINNDARWSCYKDNVSTNYIEMKENKLKYLRALHVKQNHVVFFTKKNINYKENNKNYYYKKYSEELTQNNIKINSKRCIIKKDNISYYITSEKYNVETI